MARYMNGLPNELLSQIVSEDCLAVEDLFSLVLTSRRFNTLTIPWLYHTFDTRRLRRSEHRWTPGRCVPSPTGDFARAIVRRPDFGLHVKRIHMSDWSTYWCRGQQSEEQFGPLVQAAQQIEWFHPSGFAGLISGAQDHEFLLLLYYTPNLIELEMTDHSWGHFSFMMLREAALSPASGTFHGFQKLQHVKAEGVASGNRYGEDALDFGLVSFFLCFPAIRSFTASGADHKCCHIFTDISREETRTDCPEGTSSVETMVFESCALPTFSLANPIRACRALKSFTCRWAEGPHWYRLRFEELGEILRHHQHTLERLILDVQNVQYFDWETFQDEHNVHIGGDDHKYAAIASIHDFERLAYLEVSGIILVGNSEPPSLSEILPPNLETIRILPPVQPHVTRDLQCYADVKYWETNMRPQCHVVECASASELQEHDQKWFVGPRATKTVGSGGSGGVV